MVSCWTYHLPIANIMISALHIARKFSFIALILVIHKKQGYCLTVNMLTNLVMVHVFIPYSSCLYLLKIKRILSSGKIVGHLAEVNVIVGDRPFLGWGGVNILH